MFLDLQLCCSIDCSHWSFYQYRRSTVTMSQNLLLAEDPEAQNRTKHIDVQHYLRELINKKGLIVAWVPSARMLADGFTKALTIDVFNRH